MCIFPFSQAHNISQSIRDVGEGRGDLTMVKTLSFCFHYHLPISHSNLYFFLAILLKLMGSSVPVIWYNVEHCS